MCVSFYNEFIKLNGILSLLAPQGGCVIISTARNHIGEHFSVSLSDAVCQVITEIHISWYWESLFIWSAFVEIPWIVYSIWL